MWQPHSSTKIQTEKNNRKKREKAAAPDKVLMSDRLADSLH